MASRRNPTPERPSSGRCSKEPRPLRQLPASPLIDPTQSLPRAQSRTPDTCRGGPTHVSGFRTARSPRHFDGLAAKPCGQVANSGAHLWGSTWDRVMLHVPHKSLMGRAPGRSFRDRRSVPMHTFVPLLHSFQPDSCQYVCRAIADATRTAREWYLSDTRAAPERQAIGTRPSDDRNDANA